MSRGAKAQTVKPSMLQAYRTPRFTLGVRSRSSSIKKFEVSDALKVTIITTKNKPSSTADETDSVLYGNELTEEKVYLF